MFMKNISRIALSVLAVVSFTFASCGDSKPAAENTGTTNTEDMVDGAGASLDSLNNRLEGDSINGQNQATDTTQH